MRVLITGGAGFIGSHLADALLQAGHGVTALDDLSTGRRENLSLASAHSRFTLVEADIRDAAAVAAAAADCDAIVHLAARIGMRVVVESPLETMEVNARGTETVLDVAGSRRMPVIVASTSEVYGYSTKIPSAETDPICFGAPTIGRWSYACSKAYDEFFALALHRERGTPTAVVRLFNTVGPRQLGRYGMVIPRFVNQALAGERLTVYGDGSQTRCFCYVGDVVKGLISMIERIDRIAGEVFNLGNPHEITILELANRVINAANSSSGIDFIPFGVAYPAGFEEIMRRVPDIEKARRMLSFDPSTDLDGILQSVLPAVGAKASLA